MSEVRLYEVPFRGTTLTLKLDDRDARLRGLLPPEEPEEPEGDVEPQAPAMIRVPAGRSSQWPPGRHDDVMTDPLSAQHWDRRVWRQG